MRRLGWSIVIVVSFGLAAALIAGFAPRLESRAVTRNFGRYNSTPSPTVQIERPEDTPARFAMRLAGGGVIGILIGLSSCKTIVRKFEEEFTLK